jgi:hypothetical protein
MSVGELKVLHQHMRDVLAAEHAKRDSYKDASWILNEQLAMCQAVNLERVRRRMDPITLKELIEREQLAVGHVDYAHKFALYCAELALGLPDRGP